METSNAKKKKEFTEMDISKMIVVEKIIESNPDDKELHNLSKDAVRFLSNHKWCKEIKKQWLAYNWDNLITVFYFKLVPNKVSIDEHVWVIVGDLPPAYIDVESAEDEIDVLYIYTKIMKEWVNAVKNNLPTTDCYPVNIPSEKKYATMLETRLKLIEENILSDYDFEDT